MFGTYLRIVKKAARWRSVDLTEEGFEPTAVVAGRVLEFAAKEGYLLCTGWVVLAFVEEEVL